MTKKRRTIATPMCDPVPNGEYSGTCVSTAPVAEPTVMLFTVPLSDSVPLCHDHVFVFSRLLRLCGPNVQC